MISIFVADDHPLILHGVEELLESQADMQVVGTESDPSRVATAVEQLKPDVLVQDLEMAGEVSGLKVISVVKRRHPETRVVVLSMHTNLAAVSESLQAGADGYVSKLGDMHQLIEAVQAVVQGRRFLGRPLRQEDVDQYEEQMRRRGVGSLRSLTHRELEVLSMVCRGHTSGEIAERLKIGRRTVESHRASLSSKLGVRNQAELVRFAINRGLIAER